MNFLKKFCNRTLKYDLINKFAYQKAANLPKYSKIVLNIWTKTNNIKQLSSSLLAFELIAHKKGILTKAKKSNITTKLRKGDPVGCKLTLRNTHQFNFLKKLIVEIIPKLKTSNKASSHKKLHKDTFFYQIYNNLTFNELKNHYFFFYNLPKLDVTIVANTNNKKDFKFLLKSIKFPFLLKK